MDWKEVGHADGFGEAGLLERLHLGPSLLHGGSIFAVAEKPGVVNEISTLGD